MKLEVAFLPDLVPEAHLTGQAVIVIDVLRASTTILTAFTNGAKAIMPCLTVEEALAKANSTLPRPLLGGERGGLPIEGFDLGNSPVEYTPERVRGRTIVFTTTNGTRALRHAAAAAEILVAAFGNFSTVCEAVSDRSAVHILCAGTGGQITREDILLAGAIVADRQRIEPSLTLNDQAILAAEAWEQAAAGFSNGTPLAESLRSSQGARNLITLGQEHDVEFAAQLDYSDILPVFDAADGLIQLR